MTEELALTWAAPGWPGRYRWRSRNQRPRTSWRGGVLPPSWWRCHTAACSALRHQLHGGRQEVVNWAHLIQNMLFWSCVSRCGRNNAIKWLLFRLRQSLILVMTRIPYSVSPELVSELQRPKVSTNSNTLSTFFFIGLFGDENVAQNTKSVVWIVQTICVEIWLCKIEANSKQDLCIYIYAYIRHDTKITFY